MNIRKYCHGEEKELMEIFKSSINMNAIKHYKKAQLQSWAPKDMDYKVWEKRIEGIKPYVLLDQDVIVAYADLQDNGYIDHFFVAGGQ